MKNMVSVGISNHHVHLTEEIYNILFLTPLEKGNDLNQLGEFASNQVVTLKNKNSEIKNVRILGPFRNYNQVEITRSDAYVLGVHPPVRKSGELYDSETITIIGPNGSVTLKNACIIAQRHIHMNYEKAKELGVVDNQLVKVHVKGDKSCILFAHVKVSENGFYELHIDFDDANAAGLENKEEVEIEI